MEVDMNRNKQLVYFVPDYLIEIKLAIKTRGYEMKKGMENLLIHVGFIGRLSNNNTTNFRMCEKDLITTLTSKGIKAIPAKQFSSELNVGLDWKLDTQSLLGN